MYGRWRGRPMASASRSFGPSMRTKTLRHTASSVIPMLGGPERPHGVFRGAGGLSWSPDGESLALSHRETPEVPSSIYRVSVETGKWQKLTTPPPHVARGDRQPRFSPDGANEAFVRGGNKGIYRISVEGEDERRLTFGNSLIMGLDWTPNGASIVFSPAAAGRSGFFSLWRVSASGGEPPEPLEVGELGRSPSLSRQGRRLAYEKYGSNWDIWRVAVPSAGQGTETPERFIASTGGDAYPQYSPDGTRILFGSSRSGYSEIWVCDSDGTNPTQLTFFEQPLTFPRKLVAGWKADCFLLPEGRQL